MHELEDFLKKTYGNSLVPAEEVKKILQQTAENGYIHESDISPHIEPMTPRQLISYIDHLKRKFLYEGNIFKELSRPNITEYNPDEFHSFNETINDLKEKTKEIQERWNNNQSKDQSHGCEINETRFNEILKKFIKYEKKQILGNEGYNVKEGRKGLYFFIFLILCIIYYLSLETPY
ncbi:hypothetical protein TCON_1463 [Astathelohania contejeani]|uniref:Uncharacterized protein n=1 Tax=Astathelohania contejeani TaxID=164912 RepID=A0ABQ7HYQ6_9MICR|nr:hypothetical protein TCON_1463 [Thelohania contejeani]